MRKLFIVCIVGMQIMSISGCCNKIDNVESTVSTALQDDGFDNDELDNITSEKEENNTVEQEKSLKVEEEESKQEINDISNKNEKAENIQKENKKTVVIDPGHGNHSNLEKEKQSPDSNIMKIKDGGGAQGIVTGAPEYEVNMKVAVKLKEMLEKNNFNVIMTKTSHSESPGNIDRAKVGNDNNAALEIRIHCDSSDNQSASGASMLVPENVGYASAVSGVSRQYGEVILNSLVRTCGMKNRGIMPRNDMTGFNWSKVPVVLVEMGFMSNPNEDRLLSDDEYQNKLAQGLCKGIIEALK